MARVFDGGQNFFQAAGFPYDLPTNASVVWVAKTSSDTTDMAVMGRRNFAANGGFSIKRGAANNTIDATAFGVADMSSSSNVWPADGSYHRFIVTKAGGSWTFYVDSTTAVGTASATPNATSDTDLYIGAFRDGGGSTGITPFNGSLAHVAIFASVLDSTDRASFLGGAAPNALVATPAHYWPLDNASAGDETASVGGQTLTEVGTVGYEAFGGGGSSTGSLNRKLLLGVG